MPRGASRSGNPLHGFPVPSPSSPESSLPSSTVMREKALGPIEESDMPSPSLCRPRTEKDTDGVNQPASAATASTAPRSGLANPPPSMVSDIFSKRWISAASTSSSSHLGIPDNNLDLFNDLVRSTSARASPPLATFPSRPPPPGTPSSWAICPIPSPTPPPQPQQTTVLIATLTAEVR